MPEPTIESLTAENARLLRDLGDLTAACGRAVRRCKACHRLSVPDGYICYSCGCDPTDPDAIADYRRVHAPATT